MGCSKRGDETSCVYSNGGAIGRDRRGEVSRDSEAQLRLQKLEEMVTSLMRSTKGNSISNSDKMAPSVATAEQGFDGVSLPSSVLSPEALLNMNVSERNHINPTHWTKILENVSVLPGGKLRYIAK